MVQQSGKRKLKPRSPSTKPKSARPGKLRARKRRIIVIGDLHAGSVFGLCPQRVDMPDGGRHEANWLQRMVWKEYERYAREFARPDVLFVMGDAIDGRQAKSYGGTNWTTSFDLQARIGVEAIDLWQARAVYGVRGTRYHGANTTTLVEEELLSNVRNARATGRGEYAPAQRYVEVGGKVFHLCHHKGGSRVWQYRATPVSREMVMNLIAAGCREASWADVIIRGHTHHYLMVDVGYQKGIAAPCWQVQTDYEAERNPFGWVPRVGFLEITVCGDSIDVAEHGVEFMSDAVPVEHLDEIEHEEG